MDLFLKYIQTDLHLTLSLAYTIFIKLTISHKIVGEIQSYQTSP